ncbi:hypothetical protein GS582_27700 [Rhodococcus hoagii]|nr:hypothetical protein [Prescottella equi]
MQDLDPAPAVTRTGYPQTHAGLLDFLVDVDLSDQVKEVARILITQQHRNQADVAREFHVDKSTISRRWTPFVAAAKARASPSHHYRARFSPKPERNRSGSCSQPEPVPTSHCRSMHHLSADR